jgi:hypothetical protein
MYYKVSGYMEIIYAFGVDNKNQLQQSTSEAGGLGAGGLNVER